MRMIKNRMISRINPTFNDLLTTSRGRVLDVNMVQSSQKPLLSILLKGKHERRWILFCETTIKTRAFDLAVCGWVRSQILTPISWSSFFLCVCVSFFENAVCDTSHTSQAVSTSVIGLRSLNFFVTCNHKISYWTNWRGTYKRKQTCN